MHAHSNPIDVVPLELDQIQGNILAGFNKDFQRFLFLSITDEAAARLWLKHLIPHIHTTTQVKTFNDNFRAYRDSHHGSEVGMPTATWLNIALTHSGLLALGAHDTDSFPEEFRLGMAARKIDIGDTDRSDPSLWQAPFGDPAKLHIVLLLASDLQSELDSLAAHLLSTLSPGLTLIGDQVGEDLHGKLKGHEQFGFKDGVSQPGIKGFTPSVNQNPGPNAPHQGVPGQDLLWPGEFVLGYPTQQPCRPRSSFDGPNPDPGPDSTSGPDWTRNGSYLVFRKLRQDVAGFRASVLSAATTFGTSPELAGAKLVGRFQSGCPLQLTKDETAANGFPASFDPNNGDPSAAHPDLLTANRINNFEYGDDLTGRFVPRAGHVRKAYPRDQQFLTPAGTVDPNSKLHESVTQTHRILRRGIPFGTPFINNETLEAPIADDGVDRGLLFLAYQRSIADQFEFIQKQWVNDNNFPQPGDGVDPVMSQTTSGVMTCPFHNNPKPTSATISHFVITEGGEYFFQPSISALHRLAQP